MRSLSFVALSFLITTLSSAAPNTNLVPTGTSSPVEREVLFTTNLDRPTNLAMTLSDMNWPSVASVFLALNKVNSTLPTNQKIKFWLLVPKQRFFAESFETPQETLSRVENQIKTELNLSTMPAEWMVRPMDYHRYAWLQDIGETIWLGEGGKWQEGLLDLNKPNTKTLPKDREPTEREARKLGGENSDFALMALQKIFSGFKKNHFRMPTYEITNKNADFSGNQGGNLEALPGNIPLVGNTAPPVMIQFIKKVTGLDPLIIDTSFLRVGHVDEIVSIVPSPHRCGFSLVIADPLEGLVLNRNKESFTGVKGDSILESLDYFSKSGKYLESADLDSFDANKEMRRYSKSQVHTKHSDMVISGYPFIEDWYLKKALLATQSIRSSAGKIAAKMKSTGACEDLQIIPVPVGMDYHSELDYFQADPKTIENDFFFFSTPTANMVVLGNHLMFAEFGNVPDEFAEKLRAATFSQLAKAGYTPDRIHLVDAAAYHAGMGSIHCGTFTVRRPKKMEGQ